MCTKLFIINGELSDYVSCTQNERSHQALLISEMPPIALDREGINFANATPKSNTCNLEQQEPSPAQVLAKEPTTPAHKPYMVRIQHDLNSPSAATRLRALRALRNPTGSAYTNFDVPHNEQSIITAEEREAIPPSAPTIQELMSNIVVYVEVRSGEDNRSEGVKKVISVLGARVNDKLLRDTTHVIFKDGLLSTYKKAKNWNIPVVSILWIEACKNRHMICDPKEFPISNIDRYENPELYEKMKRQRSMQPDSECNKRIRVKHGTPKDSTPKTLTETPGKSSTIIGDAFGSKTQANINQFFKKIVPTSVDKNITTTPTGTTKTTPIQKTVSMLNLDTDSPATKLLKRIDSNILTPSISTLATVTEENQKDANDNRTKCLSENPIKASTLVRKTLDFNKVNKDIDKTEGSAVATPRKRVLRRRSSIQASAERSSSECSLQMADTVTPRKTTRRRSSAAATTNMTTSSVISNALTPTCNIIEEEKEGVTSNDMKVVKSKKSPRTKRRSTYTHKPLDISPVKQTQKEQMSIPVKGRRTLYTPKKMDETLSADISWTKITTDKVLDEELLKFALTPTTVTPSDTEIAVVDSKKSLIEENSSSSTGFSSTRPPNRRRTLFDVSMDIIQQRLHNINNSARRSMANVNMNKSDSPLKQKKSMTILDVIVTPDKVNKHSSDVAKSSSDAIQKSILSPKKNEKNDPVRDSISNETPKSPIKSVKKRKLYVPNETLSISSTPTKPTTPHVKRRRTITSPQPTEPKLQSKSRRSIMCKKVKVQSRSMANVTSSTSRSLKVLTQSEPAVSTQGKSTSKEGSSIGSSIVQLDTEMSTEHQVDKFYQVPENAMETDALPTTKTLNSKTELHNKQRTGYAKCVSIKSNSEHNSKDELIEINAVNETNFKDCVAEVEESKTLPTKPASPPSPSLKQPASPPSPSLKRPASPSPIQATSVPSTSRISTKQSTSAQKMVKPMTLQKVLSFAATPKTLPKTNGSQIVPPNKTANTSTVPKVTPNINVIQKGKWPYIVCTNMHREQIKIIREAIVKLGGFDLDHYVNDDTSHVVSFEPRRTLNLLRALIRGLWILEYRWVLDSMRAGEWLSEEEYELKDFSRAVEICRTERQAFGALYKCELFADLGAFYVSSRCGPISKENLKELIALCGGKIADQRKRAKYILGDPNKTLEDKFYVTPFWVLDSITQMQMMRIQKYTYMNAHKIPAPLNMSIVSQTTQVPSLSTAPVTGTALL